MYHPVFTIHLPSYRKHLGIFKIKLKEETVLANEKTMLISEEFKHILILKLSRCSETVFVVFIRFTADICYKVAHKKNTFL